MVAVAGDGDRRGTQLKNAKAVIAEANDACEARKADVLMSWQL
jgi:hypothetical protein